MAGDGCDEEAAAAAAEEEEDAAAAAAEEAEAWLALEAVAPAFFASSFPSPSSSLVRSSSSARYGSSSSADMACLLGMLVLVVLAASPWLLGYRSVVAG